MTVTVAITTHRRRRQALPQQPLLRPHHLRPDPTLSDLKHENAMAVSVSAVITVDPVENVPEELDLDPSDEDLLVPSELPRQPLHDQAQLSVDLDSQRPAVALDPDLVLQPRDQQRPRRVITPPPKHVLSPRKQSRRRRTPLHSLSQLVGGGGGEGQPGALSQLAEEGVVAEEELEPGVAGDGEVETGLGFGRVVGAELGAGEVPVELELLVMELVGQVDGFGAGF